MAAGAPLICDAAAQAASKKTHDAAKVLKVLLRAIASNSLRFLRQWHEKKKKRDGDDDLAVE